jgi:release factor glutamine methyltransferase
MTTVRLPRGQSLNAIKKVICIRLMSIGIEEGEAGAECDIMIEHVSGMRPSQQMISLAGKLNEEQLDKLDTILSAREKRIPIQYILEETYFMGLKLKVRPGVFIPRPDTETLVEVSLKKLNQIYAGSSNKIALLEIGVGSGAIAVSLLKAMSNLDVVAVDVSEDALAVSRENAVSHKVDGRLILKQEPNWWTIDQRFQALVSNPPYIPLHQKETLQPEVGLHEPELALFGTDEDGLGFYRQICQTADNVLDRNGFIAVEVGDEQAEAVRLLFIEAGFGEVETHNDLIGIARVVTARSG